MTAPVDSPQEPAEASGEPLEDVAVPPTDDMPPSAVESEEPGVEVDPAADDASSEQNAEAQAGPEAESAPPVVDPANQDDNAPEAEEGTEVANAPDAVVEDASPAAEETIPENAADSGPPLPSVEEELTEEKDLSPEDVVDEAAGPTASEDEVEAPGSKGNQDGAETMQEGPEPAAAEAPVIEIPPPAPDPPGAANDAAQVEDGGEKKVQFAPGTPEPKTTQRKKKNGKSSKTKKSRKPHPSSEDQESPDDIVAIVEGPFDEPVLSIPAEVVPVPPEEEFTESLDAEPVTAPQVAPEEEDIKAEEPAPESVPDEAIEASAPPEPAPPEPAKHEPAKSEKSSKKRGKEKSKKKSSKSKVKVHEAPPVVSGLGIDFGEPSHDESTVVDAVEEAAVVEEDDKTQDPVADIPQTSAEEVVDAKDTEPGIEAAEPIVHEAETEIPAVPEPQPSADVDGTSSIPSDQAADEPADATDVVSEVAVADDAEDIEVTVSKVENDVAVEVSVDEDHSSTPSPGDVANTGVNASGDAESEAAVEKVTVATSIADQEDESVPSKGEETGDSNLDNLDSPKLPDSAIDLDEGSAWEEGAKDDPEPESGDGHAEEMVDEITVDDAKETANATAPADQLNGADPPDLESSVDTVDESESLVVVDDDEASAAEPEPTPKVDSSESEKSSQSESGSPQIDAGEEHAVTEGVTRERAPSIEQLSNATEIGSDTESEDEEDAYSTPHEDAGVSARIVAAVEPDEPKTAADDVKDVDVVSASADEVSSPDAETSAEPDLADAIQPDDQDMPKGEQDQAGDAPEATEDAAEAPAAAEADIAAVEELSTDVAQENEGDAIEHSPEPAEPDSAVVVPPDESASNDPSAVPDDTSEPPPSSEEAAAEIETEGEVPAGAVAEEVTASPVAEDTNAAAEVPVQEAPASEDAVAEVEVAPAVPEPDEGKVEGVEPVDPVDTEALAEVPIAEESTAKEDSESLPKPEPEAEAEPDVDAVAVGAEAADSAPTEAPEPELLAEELTTDPVPPLEQTEEPLPATEEHAEPVIPIAVPVSTSPPSEPPSPKLSRGSGSKSKGVRHQTRPSKKRSKDSDKSRDKKSSKDRRERTPEEVAERQRRKDARRLVESSRRLEEERRRFEEEEMKRIRHEVRRAARKAAAAEFDRIAREEGENLARREAEKRRKRRESDARPRERRESDVRPRERRESKTSGGLFGLAGFARTNSGGETLAKSSRDGDGTRARRVSPPKEDPVEEKEPKSNSHNGSSRRRHRRRTESDRAEPRERDPGRRTDGERRDGERRRSSKPEKPKGFFGSLFAKF